MPDADLLREFLVEAGEHLCTVEEDVLALERGGPVIDQEVVNRLFRSVHTVKGGAGFLELDRVKNLGHALESVVSAIRNGTLIPDPSVSEVLLAAADRLRVLLDNIDDPRIPIDDQVAACAGLTASGSGSSSGRTTAKPVATSTVTFRPDRYDLESLASKLQRIHECTIDLVAECTARNRTPVRLLEDISSISTLLEADADLGGDLTLTPDAGGRHLFTFIAASVIDDPDIMKAGLEIEPLRHVIHDPAQYLKAAPTAPVEPETTGATSLPAGSPQPAAPTPGSTSSPPAETPQARPAASGSAEQTVRINLRLLDNLMDLASELVLVRNQNLRAIGNRDLSQLGAIGQRLNIVTTELQSSIMQTRMRPVGSIFNRFGRVVRDLARHLGKMAVVEIRGAEVELDKTIIEAIADPLTHLVRNAVDHGIELPAQRLAQDKSEEGMVRLSAFHQAGQVVIQIDDDGKGMDPQHICRKAVEKGLVSAETAAQLTEREIYDFIFQPGFSTAETVTDVSGRGVGMDVVRSGIQALGGSITISSAPGRGSSIRIELPLTLAIIPALIVSVESICFAIPQVAIIEVVWLHGSDIYRSIKKVNDREVYWLRGTLLPLLRLTDVLDMGTTYAEPRDGTRVPERRIMRADRRQDTQSGDNERRGPVADRRESLDNSLSIVVLRLGNERFGLIVDAVVDTEEIVVKALHEQLKVCRVYAGGAVLGSGNIAMILDIAALAERGLLQVSTAEAHAERARTQTEDTQAVLQFSIGGPERFAVPLCLITRVQEITAAQIQQAHGRSYFNYRDCLIPLVRIEQAVPAFTSAYDDNALALIIPKSQRPFGIVVSRIIDTVDMPTGLDTDTLQIPCVIGSRLQQGEVVLFIDLLGVMETVDPTWISREQGRNGPVQRFLVVDDSVFYQNLLGSFLRGSGVSVTTAANGQEALDLLEKEHFGVIISDIDMPVMDGFGFIREVRRRKLVQGVPVLAVSAAEDRNLRTRALDSGFDAFRPKGNLEDLLGAVIKLAGPGRRRTS